MMRGLVYLLLAAYGVTAAGADLGRLFFTPTQRAALDGARKQNVQTEIGNDNPQEAAPLPQNISINGVVRRSDGKTTVWVNNRAITERQSNSVNIVPYKNSNRVKLTTPDSGHSIDLKVGQTVELTTGAIAEGTSHPVPATTQNGSVTAAGANGPSAVQQAAPSGASGPTRPETATRNRPVPATDPDEPNSGQ
ncbi:MAG TPA: hypothetical protein VMT94_02900 [Burkholderiales bacterium]|nr:hypothetical protein [Burkholderiales bacterium]